MTSLMQIPASSEPQAPSVLLIEAAQNVFSRLEAQLGAKIADLFAGAPKEAVLNEWASALSGFTKREVNRGLAICQTRIFAPTLGEFTRLCRPALDAEIAWLEAVDGLRARNAGEVGEWSHPAVYRAASAMSFEIASSSFKQCQKVWAWRLEKEFTKGWGEPVPPVALRVGHEVAKATAPNAEQKRKIADLLAGRVAKPMPAAPPVNQPLTDLELAALRKAEWAAAGVAA